MERSVGVRCAATIAMIALMCVSASMVAADTPPEDEASRVSLASALLEYGKEYRDPLALLNAVQLFRGLSAQVHERGGPGEETEILNLDEILHLAREFAGNDEDLLAIVDAEMKRGTKGIWSTTCIWKWAWACDFFGCVWAYQWICI